MFVSYVFLLVAFFRESRQCAVVLCSQAAAGRLPVSNLAPSTCITNPDPDALGPALGTALGGRVGARVGARVGTLTPRWGPRLGSA